MVLQAIQYTPASDSGPPSLKILDQLLLPHRSFFFPIHNCEDAHAAIKQMQVRGAPAIAIVAALALAVELEQIPNYSSSAESASSIRQYIGERLSYLKTSRPTAVNLGDAVRKLNTVVKNAAAEEKADGSRVVGRYIAAAEQMLVNDVADNKAIGAHGAKWIQEHTPAGEKRSAGGEHELKILTHCNTGSLATAGYGTALGVIRSLRSSNMLSHAYCSETRPYHQGSRLTAYELVHDKIPATLVTDSMVAALLAKEGEKLAAIIVGADRVAANGDTANKIGTYSLAVLARHHGVKFLVAAPRTTIDLATPSGDSIVIEERAAEEVVRLKGPKVDRKGKVMAEEEPETISIAALGINVWNPAFDVTPAYLIDGVITEVGVIEKASTDEYFDFRHIFDTETVPNGH